MYFVRILAALAAFAAVVSAAPLVNKRASIASTADFDELHRAAQLSSAAYSDCQGTAFDVTITLQIDDTSTDTQGYVGYSTSYERITVVMRGSTAVEDFINDIDIEPVTPTLSGVTFPDGTEVMQGVFSPWSSVHDAIITEVSRLIDLYPSYTLESTGHSLGGSLTYLSYIALAQNFPDKSVTSNAMAAFPIGNDVFADFGTSQSGTLRRGNNAGDGVPGIFTHYGTEYYTNGTAATTLVCDGETDPECSAGNGLVGPTLGHLTSYGVIMELAGCS